jgi:uncharacterized HAD superfamily protein
MNNNKILLIDIDGTVCDDIRNEESHLFPTANRYDESLNVINKWYNDGNHICFFTARREENREVTEKWLSDNEFKYHALIMNKPRCKDEQEYVWIDNRKVRGITYKGVWGDLKEVESKILTFGE